MEQLLELRHRAKFKRSLYLGNTAKIWLLGVGYVHVYNIWHSNICVQVLEIWNRLVSRKPFVRRQKSFISTPTSTESVREHDLMQYLDLWGLSCLYLFLDYKRPLYYTLAYTFCYIITRHMQQIKLNKTIENTAWLDLCRYDTQA